MIPKDALKYLKLFDENSIRYAIFAGSEVAVLTQNREPTDIDIIVHNDDFNKLIEIFPYSNINLNGVWNIKTSDSQDVVCEAKNLEQTINNTSFDIISNCIFKIDNDVIETYLTDLACDNRISFDINNQQIWLANPVDTIIIKSIMRRGVEQNKFDLKDCQDLIKKCEINKEYLIARMSETKFNEQMTKFLRQIDLITA